MPQKIIYFQQSFPNHTETFVKAEIAELLQRDYCVEVICLQANHEQLASIDFADRVFEIPRDSKDPYLALYQEIKKRSPDYLHAPWSTEAWRILRPLAEELQIPFGCSVHAADIWRRGNRLEPEELRDLGAHPQCVTIAVEGTYHRDYLRWCTVPEEKLLITPNSVPKEGLPEARELPPKELGVVCSIGRSVPKKGFYCGIDAMRFLHLNQYKVRYNIIGGGDEGSAEGKALQEYTKQFSFISATGMLPHSEALLQLRDSDALLVPSIVAENGDSDGVPTVITEAMLLGVPVVATDVGSISDLVIDGQTGYLARAADPSSLANKLRELAEVLKNQDAAAALIQRAKKQAARHETQASVNTLVAHLESKLGRFS